MASSRKSQKSPNVGKRIAVALSGGLDSVVLLDTVCKSHSPSNPLEIYAFHIHHGLQKQADEWLIFCQQLANQYKIHFDFRLLYLKNDVERGNLEARARAGRYDALMELCLEYGIQDLFLAHHQNDQAETVLLQLLRGSGVAGLAAMPMSREMYSPEGKVTLWRPLLNLSRKDLEAYAKEHRLQWIEDPSNRSTQFRRNALRKRIIPALEKIQPEAIANLARSAHLLGQAQTLLERLAVQDGQSILVQNTLRLDPLLTLAQDDLPAANNVLRHWLKANGLNMPSQERLLSWWKDLVSVKPSAQLEWMHDEKIIRLWRGTLQIEEPLAGEWIFKTISSKSLTPGLPAQWVKDAQKNGRIQQEERAGSEKIQLKANTPRKTLKNLFQEANIPPWERQAPLLYIDGELIAVAGLGVSYPHLVQTGPRLLPQWVQRT